MCFGAGSCFWHVGWGVVQKGTNQRERRLQFEVVVSGHVGWGGVQKGTNQRERRVAVWVGMGCCFQHVGWGGVQKGINQRKRRVQFGVVQVVVSGHED